jgi:hypothetical protein
MMMLTMMMVMTNQVNNEHDNSYYVEFQLMLMECEVILNIMSHCKRHSALV